MLNVEEFVNQNYQGFSDVGGKASLSIPRSLALIQCLDQVKHLQGCIAECGVFKGGTTWLMAKFLTDQGIDKRIYAFDTFSGMPDRITENDTHKAGDFANTSFDEVRRYLDFHNVHLVQGEFPDSAACIEHERFALVHADMDIYTSTVHIIKFFWPKLVPGGMIVFDDYYNGRCPGVKKAVDSLLPGMSEAFGQEMQRAIK